MKTKSLFARALVAALLVHAAPVRAANEPKDKTPWKITGQLEEACSCDAACPCWFNSKPTKMTCGGGQVLFILVGLELNQHGHAASQEHASMLV